MAKKSSGSKAPTRKPAATKPAAAKPAAPDAAAPVRPRSKPSLSIAGGAEHTGPAPTVVKPAAPVVGQPELKKADLIEAVVARSGIKKKDAKPVVEAMLAVLGETVAEGRELNLQPFGKLRINRTEQKGNGQVVFCRLRQARGAGKPAKDPLAEPAD
ncbi:DNA-binding protein HU-alpha [Cribrihabitans marinus]|uniref:DNA-binding protein HU-alpha n=1 Tax=Cribrihabitans marinus TaxID=1227549 RepID=A0A1H6R2V5_9RHOB|nr:HU family DNA-binding protein [Cribrihabitans marinus]SEI48746.1 DNA-binding protein HU-alpha [Cribrihabitans marinus]